MALLSMEHLSVTYPGNVRALQDVTFTISPGEIVGLLGANGAGKTTLLKTLCGLVEPSTGAVHWNTTRHLGVLLEGSRAFYWNLTGWENARYFAALKNISNDGLEGHLDTLFHLVGLWEARHRLAGTYSTGMKKRLSLLIALLGHPPLLLLDEPTAGLDDASTREFEDYLRNVADQGTAVVCATHDLAFAFTVASRLVYIAEGRIASWRWHTAPDKHRNVVVLLAGEAPPWDDRQDGLVHLGEDRWQIVGSTSDANFFANLHHLMQKGFHVLQIYGVN